MKWSAARSVVEELRKDKRLYLPHLTDRLGFSSTRVEHLLANLRAECEEDYLEIGVLNGRTLEAAASKSRGVCIGADPCDKYGVTPEFPQANIRFIQKRWQELAGGDLPNPIGLVFYDGNHEAEQTRAFLVWVQEVLADEAVIVVDDWDRPEVRRGTYWAIERNRRYQLLNEMPEYTQGPDFAPPNHFGYYYGVGVLGFRR